MGFDFRACRKALIGLRLPKIVLSIYDGHEIPSELKYSCEQPYSVFTEPDFLPDGGPIIPLWEAGIRITAYQNGQFIRFNLEDPDDEVYVFRTSFRSVAADLLISQYEDEVSTERLRELATLFEFDRIDKLILGCESTEQSGEKRVRWWKEFVASCS